MVIHTAFLAVALAIGMQAQPEFRDPGPELVRASTTRVSASTVLGLWGEKLYSPKEPHFDGIRIVFEQGDDRFEVKICGGTGTPPFDEGPHYCLEVNVPEGLALGPCRVHVERDGFLSAQLDLEVVGWEPPEVTELAAEILLRTGDLDLEGTGFHTTDEFEIVDSTGCVFRVEPGLHSFSEGQVLPENIALGAARVRVVKIGDPDGPSTTWYDFKVVDGPEPFELADGWMQPAASGQWIEVASMTEHAMEGADWAELVFEQGSVSFIAACVDTDALRVQIPKGLASGPATIRGRTWRAGVASDWSKGVQYSVPDRPVFPELGAIGAGPEPGQAHYPEPGSDELVLDLQDDLIVHGRFPVAAASDLVAVFESASNRLEIVCEGTGGFAFLVPTAGKLPQGVWSLTLVGRRDGHRTPTPLRIVVPRDRDSN